VAGIVDSSGRAIVRVRLKNPAAAAARDAELDVWIDTGFTGELVLPKQHVDALNLPLGPSVKVRLADGSEIELDSYLCAVEWFGEWKEIEIVANQGEFPLLGVGLLLDHVLSVDYQSMTLTLI